MRPLRVALVPVSLDVGGAERQMIALAERLPKDRFEVEFVALTHAGSLAPAAEAAGARVRVVGLAGRERRLRWLRLLADTVRFARQLRRGRYDVVDAWLFPSYALAALVRPAARFPVFISDRERLDDYKAGFGPAKRLLDAMSRRRSDAIVAVSEAVRDDVAKFEGLDPAAIRVIRNGVIIPAPMPRDERARLREGWGFGPNDMVVGSVANYKPGKGLEALLRVCASLKAEFPQLRLLLIGEGILRPVLENLVAELGLADIVRLHGLEIDARRLYGAFDIFAHASVSEGLPNAVVEAAAAARPIVATRAGGTVEAVIDGESGLLVGIGDDDGLAAALASLVLDAELRSRLGAAARARADAMFGMDRFVAETAALYEELAQRKGVRR